jgi:hypothetical protein
MNVWAKSKPPQSLRDHLLQCATTPRCFSLRLAVAPLNASGSGVRKRRICSSQQLGCTTSARPSRSGRTRSKLARSICRNTRSLRSGPVAGHWATRLRPCSSPLGPGARCSGAPRADARRKVRAPNNGTPDHHSLGEVWIELARDLPMKLLGPKPRLRSRRARHLHLCRDGQDARAADSSRCKVPWPLLPLAVAAGRV